MRTSVIKLHDGEEVNAEGYIELERVIQIGDTFIPFHAIHDVVETVVKDFNRPTDDFCKSANRVATVGTAIVGTDVAS